MAIWGTYETEAARILRKKAPIMQKMDEEYQEPITIWWDMDGTLVDLYAVDDWLPKLRAEDPSPYEEAKVMWNMSQLARLMNRVQSKGYRLGIVSWTSKNGSPEYNEAVRLTKLKSLKVHLASVKWNEIQIVEYGTPKSSMMQNKNDILFDDEEDNRKNWQGQAFSPDEMFTILRKIDRGDFE